MESLSANPVRWGCGRDAWKGHPILSRACENDMPITAKVRENQPGRTDPELFSSVGQQATFLGVNDQSHLTKTNSYMYVLPGRRVLAALLGGAMLSEAQPGRYVRVKIPDLPPSEQVRAPVLGLLQ